MLVDGGRIREVSDRPIKSATAETIDPAGRTVAHKVISLAPCPVVVVR